ncbi:hypothetical protein HUJ04_007389 [Dendroctonus ponderosae]|nr:hypothetical protein HUJ04_007389 [Dendroctonus ponderosae]
MADISDNNVEIITDNNVKITRANNVQLTTDNNVKITTDSNVEMTTDNVKITTDKNMEITTDNNMEVATDNVEITADDTEWSVMSCSACNITEMEFFEILRDRESLLNFFFCHNVLTCHTRCKCGALLNPTEDSVNHFIFRCRKKNLRSYRKCKTNFTILKGTFFENSALSLGKVAHLVMLYLCRPSPRYRYICVELNLSIQTVSKWFSHFRDIFIFWVNQQSSQIGGEGKIVEIEWCSGGHLVEGPWIFGGIEKSTGQFFVVPTEDSSSATFLHIFQEKVRPGSTVVSDIWKPSEYLDDEDVHNLTVNYSMNFEDLQIDFPCWANVRRLIPRKGRRKKYYLGYLSEALFMVHYPIHTQRFHSFWVSVGRMYPPITQA